VTIAINQKQPTTSPTPTYTSAPTATTELWSMHHETIKQERKSTNPQRNHHRNHPRHPLPPRNHPRSGVLMNCETPKPCPTCGTMIENNERVGQKCLYCMLDEVTQEEK